MSRIFRKNVFVFRGLNVSLNINILSFLKSIIALDIFIEPLPRNEET